MSASPSASADTRAQRIHAALEQALQPTHLRIVDDSARHAGHAGAARGGGHYHVEIVSARFRGLAPLARHRLVYETLTEMMSTEIHALAITARTPEEYSPDVR